MEDWTLVGCESDSLFGTPGRALGCHALQVDGVRW